MSVPSFHVGTFQFPDTPGARRLADQYGIQSARRAAVHRTICFPPTVVQTVGFNSPGPNLNDPSIQRRLFSPPPTNSPNVQPDPAVNIEFLDVNDPDLSASAYSAMAIQSMLTGTGQPIKHTSADVVNSLMGTCDVPTLECYPYKLKNGTSTAYETNSSESAGLYFCHKEVGFEPQLCVYHFQQKWYTGICGRDSLHGISNNHIKV